MEELNGYLMRRTNLERQLYNTNIKDLKDGDKSNKRLQLM